MSFLRKSSHLDRELLCGDNIYPKNSPKTTIIYVKNISHITFGVQIKIPSPSLTIIFWHRYFISIRFHLLKYLENVRMRGCQICFLDSLREQDDLVNALSITSNSLTGRQRKDLLSHGWRIKSGYVMLPIFSYKAFNKSPIRSTSQERKSSSPSFVVFIFQ